MQWCGRGYAVGATLALYLISETFRLMVYLGVYRYRGIMGLCRGCDFGALSYLRDFSAYGISGGIRIYKHFILYQRLFGIWYIWGYIDTGSLCGYAVGATLALYPISKTFRLMVYLGVYPYRGFL